MSVEKADQEVIIKYKNVTIDEEFFDYILYKLRLKILVWASVIVSLATGIMGIGIYSYFKDKASEYTKKYAESEQFKLFVNSTFRDQYKEIDKRISNIDASINKLAIYEAAPYVISENSLTTVDHNGNHITIEYGSSTSSNKIIFKSKFSEPPTVVASLHGNPGIKDDVFSVTEVTKESFWPKHRGGLISHRFNWIAIGK